MRIKKLLKRRLGFNVQINFQQAEMSKHRMEGSEYPVKEMFMPKLDNPLQRMGFLLCLQTHLFIQQILRMPHLSAMH